MVSCEYPWRNSTATEIVDTTFRYGRNIQYTLSITVIFYDLLFRGRALFPKWLGRSCRWIQRLAGCRLVVVECSPKGPAAISLGCGVDEVARTGGVH